jgi:hypothetical protein
VRIPKEEKNKLPAKALKESWWDTMNIQKSIGVMTQLVKISL